MKRSYLRLSEAMAVLSTAAALLALSPPLGAAPEKQVKEAWQACFQKALPTGAYDKTALSYHDIEINLAEPESREALVPISKYGIAGQSFYARADGLNAPYYRCLCPESNSLRLRKSVLEKLQRINANLSLLGLELFVFDAYRPVSCQKKLWAFFMDEARRVLKSGADESDLVSYAGKFCSNPSFYKASDWKTWPTHSTGGAVDLTLRRKNNGELLFMGSIFDDASELSISNHFEKCENEGSQPSSYLEARRNRRLLYWAMKTEGFANYPNEWWHFDFGNQMWVQNHGADQGQKAFYGAI